MLWRACAAVLIDVDTLNTLPDRELVSGISEIIKYGLIRDPDLFVWLEGNMERLLKRDPEARRLSFLVTAALLTEVLHIPACTPLAVVQLPALLKASDVTKARRSTSWREHAGAGVRMHSTLCCEHAGADIRDRALVREQGAGGGRG